LLVGLAAAVLALHPLIHLMGTAAYTKLADVPGLPYKTMLRGGRWDVGEQGIQLFGALWTVAAIGFVVSSVALLARWTW
jgi:hypothetical protein